MKRILALILSLCFLLSLASCAAEEIKTTVGAEENATLAETVDSAETKAETTVKPEKKPVEYPVVADKISWDTINSYPIANSSMSTDELRKLCVDFFRFDKTFAWTPSEDYHFIKNAKGAKDSINAGYVYGGLPYVGLGTGNVYRTMDYYDVETGIVDMEKAGADRYLFGNQCSVGAYWGWGRVVNSAQYDWSYNMVQSKGFLRVGPYTYDDALLSYNPDMTTKKICQENGEEVMYQSYAALKPADGLVYYTSAGHVIMCVENHVVYNPDNTINPDESYIIQIDQSQSWKDLKQSNGDPISIKTGVDTKRTYAALYEDHYLPFTFAEFLGTDPVEDTECVFSYSGDEITITKLRQVIITSNYGMSDLYAYIKSKEGEILYTCVQRMESAGVMRTTFDESIPDEAIKYAVGFDVEVVCQLSNGDRPVIYKGVLKN